MEKKKLVVLLGPTAVGKTKLSIELADQIGGQIISADSMQFYKGLDIGTAKIKEKEKYSSRGNYIKHFGIDILEPQEDYSLAIYQKQVQGYLREIEEAGKIPILVGGTGLYINSIIYSHQGSDLPCSYSFRNEMQALARRQGKRYLKKMLEKIDQETGQRLHENDQRRIIRALEVYHLTGKKFSEVVSQDQAYASDFDLRLLGLIRPRDVLYERIEQRVDQMIAAGLLEEVKKLWQTKISFQANSMQGLGYRQSAFFLQGLVDQKEMIRLLKRDTRHFAKRQLTWFKRDPNINWYDLTEQQDEETLLEAMVTYIKK